MKRKIAIFLVTILCLAIIIPTMSYATDSGLGDLNQYGGDSGGSSVELEQKAEIVLGIIQVIGVVISVVMLIVIGIKYMVGSIEERAEYNTLKQLSCQYPEQLRVYGFDNSIFLFPTASLQHEYRRLK